MALTGWLATRRASSYADTDTNANSDAYTHGNPTPTPTPTATPTLQQRRPRRDSGNWHGRTGQRLERNVEWRLDKSGGVTSEDTCVEGVNCETFTFAVLGTQSDWIAANERVQVRLSWQNSANEYDIYLHKGANSSGPLVTSSIQGPGLTHQTAFIDVAQFGTGVFTVHVAYDVTATSAVDPYRGAVSAVPQTFPTAPAATQDTGPKLVTRISRRPEC